MMKIFLLVLWAITLTGIAHTAFAADTAAAPRVVLKAYRVLPDQAGRGERLETLDTVRPGDTVEYEATYDNPTNTVARNVRVTVPVPEGGFVYMDSAAAPFASTDGRSFQPTPLMRTETAADGRKLSRRVPLSEYRFLRWDLGDVAAGASRSVRARMAMPALAAVR